MSGKSVLSVRAGGSVESEIPLRGYLLSVGGALLLLLLAADWVLPAPLPSRLMESHSALPPIRIHSELRGPEAVVIDTNRPVLMPMPRVRSPRPHGSYKAPMWPMQHNSRARLSPSMSVRIAPQHRRPRASAKAWRSWGRALPIWQVQVGGAAKSRRSHSAGSLIYGAASCGDLPSIRASIPRPAHAIH